MKHKFLNEDTTKVAIEIGKSTFRPRSHMVIVTTFDCAGNPIGQGYETAEGVPRNIKRQQLRDYLNPLINRIIAEAIPD